MAKNVKVKGQPEGTPEGATAPAEAAPAVAKTPAAPRSRGPKGTTEDAVITLLAATNPKRPNSKAYDIFSQYENGMTIKAFVDKVEAKHKGMSTVALVYDAKHGFINIAGYDPGAIIVPKVRVAKEKKEKAPKDVSAEANKEAVAAETTTEQMV